MTATSALQLSLPWDTHFRAIGASVAGVSHQDTGTVCQDSHCWVCLGDKVILAAADGASSAPHSDVGSATAAKAAAAFLADEKSFGRRRLTALALEESLRAAFARALTAVEQRAKELSLTPRDLTTTLTVMVATPNLVGAAQIGDGFSVFRDDGDNLVCLTIPRKGEYFNETYFLSQPELERIQLKIVKACPSYVAVSTDGLDELALKYPSWTPHAKFFTPIFECLARRTQSEATNEVKEFLLSGASKRSFDDLTLVVAQLIK